MQAVCPQHVDGGHWDPNRGDWSNDRHGDGWLPVMNIGVAWWRNVLRDRIDRVITDYEVDSYFMDIAGL